MVSWLPLGGEAQRGTEDLGDWGVHLGYRGGKLSEEGGQAARGRSRGSAGAQVCAGFGPGLRPARQASCSLPPRLPAATHSPGPAADQRSDARKQGCFYLLASACGFLRHSAGTIIKLICI